MDKDKYGVALNEIIFLRRPIAKVLEKIKKYDFITPNLLTLMSFAFALAACAALLLSGYRWLVVSAALIILSYLLDCADGRLARLKNMESGFGFWLDRITDQIKLSLLILALGLRAYYIDQEGAGILIIAALTITAQLIKEFNWSIFEIFRLKTQAETGYAQFVLDNIGLEFSKDSLKKRILFIIARTAIFLHYEQIFVLSVFPLIFKARATIYIYALMSLISFSAKTCAYINVYRKTDAQRNHRTHPGSG